MNQSGLRHSARFSHVTREAIVVMANAENVRQQQHVDKNPNERPGESLYDKETRESREKLGKMTKKEKAKKCK